MRGEARIDPITSFGKPAIAALAMVSVVNFINFFDRTLITVVSPSIKAEFGLTDTQWGFLVGPAFISVYMVMTLVCGRLVDRRSRKSALAVILGLWSVMTVMTALARSHGALLLARAGVGVGEGGATPVSMSLLSDCFPPRRRTLAAAIWNVSGMLGILLSFLIGGLLADALGWRAAFLVAGAAGLLLVPVLVFGLREPPRGTMDLQDYRKCRLAKG